MGETEFQVFPFLGSFVHPDCPVNIFWVNEWMQQPQTFHSEPHSFGVRLIWISSDMTPLP